MALPCSANQLNKLGKRLARDEPTADDLVLFAQVVNAYQEVLDEVERRLELLGYQATTRVKTTGTLLDKLRRDQTLKLSAVHDLAGARIVIDGNRNDQDETMARIVDEFTPCPKLPRVKDRRNGWAQFAEKLGDSWGRGLRYGLGPEAPDSLAGPPFGPDMTRAQVVEGWAAYSELIDDVERLELDFLRVEAAVGVGESVAPDVMVDLKHRHEENKVAFARIRGNLTISVQSEERS
jgi:hypothetical protein